MKNLLLLVAFTLSSHGFSQTIQEKLEQIQQCQEQQIEQLIKLEERVVKEINRSKDGFDKAVSRQKQRSGFRNFFSGAYAVLVENRKKAMKNPEGERTVAAKRFAHFRRHQNLSIMHAIVKTLGTISTGISYSILREEYRLIFERDNKISRKLYRDLEERDQEILEKYEELQEYAYEIDFEIPTELISCK